MSDFCDCDYGEYCDVWDQATVKARKYHKCSECKESIKPDEEYERIAYLFDGDWNRLKICQYCWHDYKVLKDLGYCLALGDGELKEAWEQHWAPNKKPADLINHTPKLM